MIVLDDRPIKPAKNAQPPEEPIKKPVSPKPYLKKRSHPQIMPCQVQPALIGSKSPPKASSSLSKAQLYDLIKKKRQQIFGDKKAVSPPKPPEPQPKLHPSKMTVQYLKKPIIQTDEFKKPDYKPTLRPQIPTKSEAELNKEKYQKLLTILHSEFTLLQEQKKDFQQVALTASFKKMIKTEPKIKLPGTISPKVQAVKPKDCAEELKNVQMATEREKRNIQLATSKMNKLLSSETTQFMSASVPKKLSIVQWYLPLQVLTIQKLSYEVKLTSLLPEQNELFKESQKLDKFPGNSKEVDGVTITKYQNGWSQAWRPGKQRIRTNGQGYKVVLLQDGDIKQRFPNKVQSYYDRSKKVVRLSLASEEPIYFFPALLQLQQLSADKKVKTIVTADGSVLRLPLGQQV